MTTPASLLMLSPRRLSSQLWSLLGTLYWVRIFAVSARVGACVARAARYSHFSTDCCIVSFSVVVTVYPPVSTCGQLLAWSAPHRIVPSCCRTCHTNCGAFH